MKKIAIPSVQYPSQKPTRSSQRLYRVYLGEGKLNTFKSNKEALAFVAETNRQLNGFLHQVNMHYAELFSMYRHCWFYFLDKAKGVNRLPIENQIKCSFEIVDSSLNRCIHNTTGTNGNTFAFSFLYSALDQLQNIAQNLKQILLIRNELVNRYKIDITIVQLKELAARIDGYGRTENRV